VNALAHRYSDCHRVAAFIAEAECVTRTTTLLEQPRTKTVRVRQQGYGDIRTLVAFSGTVVDEDAGGASYTEPQMNGFGEKELPERFDSGDYQVLLVAEKYQTGFDQPLLHSMYVDKRLDGVQAVQTLSRLNRIARGKEDTFVLDFRNDPDDIYKAFKPYYAVTQAGDDVGPQKLYELQAALDHTQVYYQTEVDGFCKTFFAAKVIENLADHPTLNRIVDQAVERFNNIDEDAREEFRGRLISFRNLYAFLSQVVPYPDSDLEKLYTYARFLQSKLPRRKRDDAIDLDDDVELKFYRLQKIGEGSIQLHAGEPEPLIGPTDVGTGVAEDERVKLSSLIDLTLAAKANNVDDFKLKFEKELEGLFIDRMDGNSSIFRRLMEDENFRNVASEWLASEVYQRARERLSQ
jgi:type I restriction enzyme, R subunit